MSNKFELSTVAQKYLPANVNLAQLQQLDEVTNDFYQIVTADDKSPAAAVLRAAVMQRYRELLTPAVMEPIMSLQGNKLGFITDKDRKKGPRGWEKGDGYPVEIVRDVTIWAAGHGARMVNNEVNILVGNGYLTREYFGRKLDDVLGPENHHITPDIPVAVRGGDGKPIGAKVSGTLFWRDSSGEHTETRTLAIKGDEYSSPDAYIGKFERKCRKYILERCTGQRYPDGEAGDVIEAEVIEESETKKSPLEGRRGRPPKNQQQFQTAPRDQPVDAEIVTEEKKPELPPVARQTEPPQQQEQPVPGAEKSPEVLLAEELNRRGEFITVESIREYAFENGFEFDAAAALNNLDAILEAINGEKK